MTLNDALVVVIFVFGFLCHVLKVANEDVKKTLFPSKRAWFCVFWPNVVVRLALVCVVWLIYSSTPDLVVKLLQHFGINFNNALPVTKCTSFIAGFFSDSLLDLGTKKIPFLGREVPPAYIAAEVKAQAQKVTTDDPNPHNV